ncbi:MAG: hypothetical protein WCO06_00745 [Candidatus Roizmanbacteria bacterium]
MAGPPLPPSGTPETVAHGPSLSKENDQIRADAQSENVQVITSGGNLLDFLIKSYKNMHPKLKSVNRAADERRARGQTGFPQEKSPDVVEIKKEIFKIIDASNRTQIPLDQTTERLLTKIGEKKITTDEARGLYEFLFLYTTGGTMDRDSGQLNFATLPNIRFSETTHITETDFEMRLKKLAFTNVHAAKLILECISELAHDTSLNHVALFGIDSAQLTDRTDRIRSIFNIIEDAPSDVEMKTIDQEYSGYVRMFQNNLTTLNPARLRLYAQYTSVPGVTDQFLQQMLLSDLKAYIRLGERYAYSKYEGDITSNLRDINTFRVYINQLLEDVFHNVSSVDRPTQIETLKRFGDKMQTRYRERGQMEMLTSNTGNESMDLLMTRFRDDDTVISRILENIPTQVGQPERGINLTEMKHFEDFIESSVLSLLNKLLSQPEGQFQDGYNQLLEGRAITDLQNRLLSLANPSAELQRRYFYKVVPGRPDELDTKLLKLYKGRILYLEKKVNSIVRMAEITHNIPIVLQTVEEDKVGGYIGQFNVAHFAMLTNDKTVNLAINFFPVWLQRLANKNGNKLPSNLLSEIFVDAKRGQEMGEAGQVYGNVLMTQYQNELREYLEANGITGVDDNKIQWLTHVKNLSFITTDAFRVLKDTSPELGWAHVAMVRYMEVFRPQLHALNIGRRGSVEKNVYASAKIVPLLPCTPEEIGIDSYERIRARGGQMKEGKYGKTDTELAIRESINAMDAKDNDCVNAFFFEWVMNQVSMDVFEDLGGWRLTGYYILYNELQGRGSGNDTPPKDWSDFFSWMYMGEGPGVQSAFYFVENRVGSDMDKWATRMKGYRDILKKRYSVSHGSEERKLTDWEIDSGNTGDYGKRVSRELRGGELGHERYFSVKVDRGRGIEQRNYTETEMKLLRSRSIRGEIMYTAFLKDPGSALAVMHQSMTFFTDSLTKSGKILASFRNPSGTGDPIKIEMKASDFYFNDNFVAVDQQTGRTFSHNDLVVGDKEKIGVIRTYVIPRYREEGVPHLKYIMDFYGKATELFGDKSKAIEKIDTILKLGTARLRNDKVPRSVLRRDDLFKDPQHPTHDEQIVADLMFSTFTFDGSNYDGFQNYFIGLVGGTSPAIMTQTFGDFSIPTGGSINDVPSLGKLNNFFNLWAKSQFEVDGLVGAPKFSDYSPDAGIKYLQLQGPNPYARFFGDAGEVHKVTTSSQKIYGMIKNIAVTGDIKSLIEMVEKNLKKIESILSKPTMQKHIFLELYTVISAFKGDASTDEVLIGWLNQISQGRRSTFALDEFKGDCKMSPMSLDSISTISRRLQLTSYLSDFGQNSGSMLMQAFGVSAHTSEQVDKWLLVNKIIPNVVVYAILIWLIYGGWEAKDELDLEDGKKRR